MKHTQSPSVSDAGTNTLTSLDFAVVIEASKESLPKYSWQPAVLSTEIVGAEPYKGRFAKKRWHVKYQCSQPIFYSRWLRHIFRTYPTQKGKRKTFKIKEQNEQYLTLHLHSITVDNLTSCHNILAPKIQKKTSEFTL